MSASARGFGFQSKAGQFSYPFLLAGMLLVHRYVYTANPDLKDAEFAVSIAVVVWYVVSRKFLKGPAMAPYQSQLGMIERLCEVFIGINVLASLIYALLLAAVG